MKFEIGMQREKELGVGDVVFAFCNHRGANASRIAETIAACDPDIVAMEMCGLDDATRLDTETRINSVLSHGDAIHTYDLNSIELALLEQLHGSGTSFCYIDMSSDHPLFAITVEEGKMRDRYLSLLYQRRQVSSHKLQSAAHQYLLAVAQSDAMREEVMAGQIDELARRYDRQRIAVMTGATHTRIARLLSVDVPLYRYFVPYPSDEKTLQPGQHAKFDAEETAIRALVHAARPKEDILDDVVDERGYIRPR